MKYRNLHSPNLISLMLLTMVTNVATADSHFQVPAIPMQTTPEICRQIESHWYAIKSALHKRLGACQSQNKPRFGKATICGEERLVAWRMCGSYRNQLCGIQARQSKDAHVCKSRMRRESNRWHAISNNNDVFLGIYENTKVAIDRTTKILNYIDSPSAYLRELLKPKPFAAIRKSVFSAHAGTLDQSSASDLYSALHESTSAGLGATRNPISRSIQKSVFREVARQHARTLRQLDELIAVADRFDQDSSDDTYWRQVTIDSSNRLKRLSKR